MFNDNVIKGVIVFSGIVIILMIIPMFAYFITTILTVPFMLLGSIIFGDNEISVIIVSIISISMFLAILLYTEYRYISSVSSNFFKKRLSKEGREKRDAKKARKERKMEGLFDIIETIKPEK